MSDFDRWVPRPDCQHCEAAAAEIEALRAVVRECIEAIPANGPVFMDDGSTEGNRWPIITDPHQQAAVLRAIGDPALDSGHAIAPPERAQNGSNRAGGES